MKYMIGVDVGGTFTDFSVFEQESGRLFHFKHSSTNYDSSVAIVNGILEVLNMEHATSAAGGLSGARNHGLHQRPD